MMEIKKWLPLKEFVDYGYLQEVNRRFFHPLGLALVVEMNEQGVPTVIQGICDEREDPEGVFFGEDWEEDPQTFEKFKRVLLEEEKRGPHRHKLLGDKIQPVIGPSGIKYTHSSVAEAYE